MSGSYEAFGITTQEAATRQAMKTFEVVTMPHEFYEMPRSEHEVVTVIVPRPWLLRWLTPIIGPARESELRTFNVWSDGRREHFATITPWEGPAPLPW